MHCVANTIMSTSVFVSEANKLKNILLHIEKSDYLLIEHIAKQEDSNIRLFINDLHELRNRECKTAQSEILNILESVNEIRTKIYEDLNNINLTSLKKEMVIIQENIKNYKQQTKVHLTSLEQQEKCLCEDIQSYEQKIIDWSKPTQVIIENIVKPNYQENINESHHVQEVKEFLKFIKDNGGYENGWSVDHHNLFLKLRNRYKDINHMSKILHTTIPDLSEKEILAHEHWYLQYLNLKTKQREAIKLWRQTKLKNEVNTGKCKSEEELVIVNKLEVKNDVDIKEKLEAWKEEKKIKLKKQTEIENILAKAQKDIEKKKKQRNEQVKKGVTDWKIEKKSAMQTIKAEQELVSMQEKEYKVSMAKKLIKQFQSQDDIFIQKIKEKRILPRVKSVDRMSSRKSNTVPLDRGRHLQPTQQWLHRISSRESESRKKDDKFVCNIKDVAKLGIPAWRKDS